jgi:diguanylate cyclase (GGDEF)-like protein
MDELNSALQSEGRARLHGQSGIPAAIAAAGAAAAGAAAAEPRLAEPTPLRVLIVEDSEGDARLVRLELEAGGYAVHHQRVHTAAAMADALASAAWDIILCDFMMPGFTGLQAIQLLQLAGLDIPLVLISGNIAEETAVEAMRAGARDYLLKSNLQRLVPAVRRELHEAGERRAARAAAEELRHLASYDRLSGLPNRNLLLERLRQSLARAEGSARSVAVLAVDVRGVGEVNESSGYETGDAVLKKVAHSLQTLVCEGDTLARLDGDRFALVLAEPDAKERVAEVSQQLVLRLAELVTVGEQSFLLSANVGIAVFPEDGGDAETLLKHANSALSLAKRQGRGALQFFSRDLAERQARRALLASEMRRGMERGELFLVYQPQVDLRSGSVMAFEALLRWQHAERGLISPAEFVPIAEDLGLMVPIGEWLIGVACRQLGEWKAAGLGDLRMGINLAPQQLCQPELVQMLTRIVTESGIDASQIDLELTENTLLASGGRNLEQIHALRKLGFSFAIDDFGTGYCNFAYLREFPVDSVKIDRSFVHGVTTNPTDAAICASITSVAHALKLLVIAEGVETKSELACIAGFGCDQVQGYLFSRPLGAADATALLREGRKLEVEHAADAEARTLLIVDDEPNVALALNRALRREGYRILIANGADEGFELLARNRVGVIISDQRMPVMNGTEFLRRVKDLYPHTVRMVLSGYTDLQSVTDAINQGDIYKFLTKPWEDKDLRDTLRDAFARQELAAENARLSAEISAANQLLEAALAAKSDQLDRGETVLKVAYEALAAIPVAVLGIDPAGMIALSNVASDALLGGGAPLVGSFAEERLPQALLDYLAPADGSGSATAQVAGGDYQLVRHTLGASSGGAGTLLTLLRRTSP